MMYENLWPDSIESNYASTENIKLIMKDQASYLKEKTHGNVRLKFMQIKNVYSTAATYSLMTANKISQYFDNGQNTERLKDANELYDSKSFGCEIYNDTYRFRLFEMDLRPLYPIFINIDEGIVEDIEKYYLSEEFISNTIQIDSDEDYIKLLKLIFGSRKLAFILDRLNINK